MRVVDKCNCVKEVVDTVLTKAGYQKVVLCLDETSDAGLIDDISKKIGNKVVLIKYYYNKNNIDTFFNMINNGVRVVIYNVTNEHFYNLQSDSGYILNIFIAQSNFLLPYIANVDSLYGDNLLVCDTSKKDYASLIYMYQMALTRLWGLLIQNLEVDTTTFKNIDILANGEANFHSNLISQMQILKSYLNNDYMLMREDEVPYYIYLQLCSILKMLENINNGAEEYIDFYKTERSQDGIDKAYSLILGHDIIDTIKLHNINLIKISGSILNRVKIIIKKYFNFKNIKLNKIIKLIKNQSKLLNIDNLLYISYIFNAI